MHKLTTAQIRALRAVSEGKVTHYEPLRINSNGKKLFGCRKDTLKQLCALGFVTLPSVKSGCHTAYVLTELGKYALEEK